MIQPVLGHTLFFGIAFANPWSQRKRFRLRIDDPGIDDELKLVTNLKEVSNLKERFCVQTIIKRHLFEREDVDEIVLGADETVYIPFKFRSFCCGK